MSEEVIEENKAVPTAPPAPSGPPPWFDGMLANMLSLYPSVVVRPQTVHTWWVHLQGVPRDALVIAFAASPLNCDPTTIPSAELVRRLALQVVQQTNSP